MFEQYISIMQGGLGAQLENQPKADVILRFKNYLSDFLTEPTVCSCYLNRLLGHQEEFDQESAQWARYIIIKFLQRMPFARKALEVGALFQLDGRYARLKELVDKTDAPAEAWAEVKDIDGSVEEREQTRRELALLLKKHPACLAAVQKMIELCLIDALDPKKYLTAFRSPAGAEREVNAVLFMHYARLGQDEQAMKCWQNLTSELKHEAVLNVAAEMFRRAGDTGRAIGLYERSLVLDPLQTPVRLRLEELKSPFLVNPALKDERRVVIYLYTWNKSSVFEQTLDSLSQTELGNARIKVLLNGCTDSSPEVARAAKEKFPKNDFEIIETPVNIGAPAARNWLINLPATWESDYVAFLDDDVTLQADWLDHFLTLMEADSEIGVVGAKILSPENPPRIQYLFRHVDVANEVMLKMSLEAPISEFDTGQYDYVRPARSVMGCQHLFRTEALRAVPHFDIQFSPSQVDDIDHDLMLNLKGFKVMYTGLVSCIHHQSSGVGQHAGANSLKKMGNAVGNDLKLCFKHMTSLDKLARLDGLSLVESATGERS